MVKHRSSLLLLLAAIAGGSAGLMKDHAWIVTGALLAGASVVLYFAREVIGPLWRNYRLHDPIELEFVITKKDWADLSYVEQDNDQHRTKDLVLPSYSNNLYIQLQYRVKISFRLLHLAVHFTGNQDESPYIDRWYLPFIKRGRPEKSPESDDNHYIDHHLVYHITDMIDRTKRDFIQCGFQINTREPGEYYLHFEISAEGVPSIHKLMVIVEDKPHTRVRCFEHSDCFISPASAPT